MRSTPALRRHFAIGTLVAALALGACSDDTSPTEEPELASMIVTLEANSYTATSSGFSAPVVTLPGGSTTVSAAFLRSDATFDPIVSAPDFQLTVAGDASGGALPAGVTFNRTSSFAGTLVISGTTPIPATPIYFGLRHIPEAHDDFGPFALTIQRF